LITKDVARIAGWDMVPGKLTSGTVARIDGNTATIALGTNATTHTSTTPQPSLFFVSASEDPIFFVGENFSYVNDVLTAGGWKIGNQMMSSSVSADTDGIIIDAEAKSISFHGTDGLDSFSPGTATRNNVRFAVGQVATNVYGMRAYDGSGNTLLSITDTPEALIAGWNITTDAISKTNITLNATIPSLRVSDGVEERIRVGDLKGVGGYTSTDTNYGIIGFDGGGDTATEVMFELSNQRNVIAGWTISTDKIASGTNIVLDAAGEKITLANGAMGFGYDVGGTDRHGLHIDATNHIYSDGEFIFGSIGDGGQYISASNGNIEISSSDFHLTNTGNVTMAGKITAATGQIGGWTIGTNNLQRGASSPEIILGTVGGNRWGIALDDNTDGDNYWWRDEDDGRVDFNVGDGTRYLNFTTSTGILTVAGTINALAGTFGGWTIGTNAIYFGGTEGSPSFFLSGSASTSAGNKTGMAISGSGFNIKASGQISASTFKFSDNLSGDISAARYGDAAFDNYVYNDGSSFNIQTEAFNLNTANIIISSSNNGVIALGGVPPTDYIGVGADRKKGFYVSGLGNLLIGTSEGTRIQFNASANNLILSASSFMLGKGSTGTGGQFISGSPDGSGTIEISSSNFHLTKTGDITMAGTVSASAGDIGGWNIEDGGLTQLSASKEIGMSTNSGSFYVQDNVTKQYLARFGFFSIDDPGLLSSSFFDRFDNGGFETGPGTGWSFSNVGSDADAGLTTTSGEYHGGNDAAKITFEYGSSGGYTP